MNKYDLMVIGGGTAGLVVASGAAQLGARVALVEKKALGGDCLYTGCVPSKTFIRSARFAADVGRATDFGFTAASLEFKDGSFASITDRVARVIETVGEINRRRDYARRGSEDSAQTSTSALPLVTSLPRGILPDTSPSATWRLMKRRS